jgi:hypothetical protein
MIKKSLAFLVVAALAAMFFMAVSAAPAWADTVVWSNDFDSYAAGTNIVGLDGFAPWIGSPNLGEGFVVSNLRAHSGSNSLTAYSTTNPGQIVRELSGIDSGRWVFTFWQYVESGLYQSCDVDLFSAYDSSSGDYTWTSDLYPDPNDGQFWGDTPGGGGKLPRVTDRWVEVRVEIDLDANTQTAYYDGSLLYEEDWGQSGTAPFAAFDVYAMRTPVYFDDFSLVRVGEQPTMTPKMDKQAALGELQNLLPTLTDRTQRSLVNKAISSLSRSLTASYWLDDSHLRERYGSLVFANAHIAVSYLQTAIKWGLDADLVEKSVIAPLVDADRLLASTAIDDAKVAGGKARFISLAEKWFAKGEGYAAAGRAVSAIDMHGGAWRYAVTAY